jgi:tRNA nucleotidyltransferase/poly(A) polymerase
MPDYIYLLENRLSQVQQNALKTVRELAREAQMTVFLAGGAVRDLTCGNPVRDLEVVVNGNALELKAALLAAGANVWGEDGESRSLYLYFPGSVRLDLSSAKRVEYPKAGTPTYFWESIQEDLRSRDFTINAMAISLNEGSFGLLMDPTNGVADMEARVLRLVSNYGFLDNPVRLIAATRYKARLGFDLEERTQTRYENAKGDEVIEYLSVEGRGWELESIAHEDEPLKVLEALEAEGWTRHLFPAWTAAKADTERLTALHDLAVELQIQGVHPDLSAAQMQLLTAKIAAKELAALKKLLPRPGFVEQWNRLDADAAEFAKLLLSKENAAPSATYKLLLSHAAEPVLWLAFTSKQAAVKEKFENFLKVWPQARQRVPYALMLDMRITPELPEYAELVKTIFLQLIDGGLNTTEEMRALLEPYSPPAPPPPVTIKRTRAKKGAEAKSKSRLADDADGDGDELDSDDETGDGDDDDIDGLDLDGDEMDFSIGADDARVPLPVEDGEEDDVFARDSVSDALDLDSDGELDDEDSDGEASEESDEGDEDEAPKKGRGGAAAKPVKAAGKPAKSAGKPAKAAKATKGKPAGKK